MQPEMAEALSPAMATENLVKLYLSYGFILLISRARTTTARQMMMSRFQNDRKMSRRCFEERLYGIDFSQSQLHHQHLLLYPYLPHIEFILGTKMFVYKKSIIYVSCFMQISSWLLLTPDCFIFKVINFKGNCRW